MENKRMVIVLWSLVAAVIIFFILLSATSDLIQKWLWMRQVAYQNASLLGADGTYYPGYVDAADLTITQIPEPTTLALLALGGLTLGGRKRIPG